MRKFTVTLYIIIYLVSSYVYSASILDFLTLTEIESRDESVEDSTSTSLDDGKKNCLCNGPSCICCIDFNMTLIDLGGPGCVRLKYLSADEGIALNVSYGDNLLHTETVRGPDPAPTCLNIFSKLAQMCARFSELLPTDDGLRGCMQLEPVLLGEVQLELPLGCFRMGSDGMHIIDSATDVIKEQEPEEETTERSEAITPDNSNGVSGGLTSLGGFSADEILAAVNHSADEGIELISSWLGLTVKRVNKTEIVDDKDKIPTTENQEIKKTEEDQE